MLQILILNQFTALLCFVLINMQVARSLTFLPDETILQSMKRPESPVIHARTCPQIAPNVNETDASRVLERNQSSVAD